MIEANKAIASPSRRSRKTIIIPIDVVEEIFLRLPVKTLIQLKCLSKQWRSTIESLSFAERHSMITEQSHMDHPKLMVISKLNKKINFSLICSESASCLSLTSFSFPTWFLNSSIYVSQSYNGFFCLHSQAEKSVYVVNPTTRWLQRLPPARVQILMPKSHHLPVPGLALVKAADYKLVWLYDSDRFRSDALSPVTKCEVFDFRANSWRYLTCTPSHPIYCYQTPAYANGWLYWFTFQCKLEIKVVAFNVDTETFRLLPIHPTIATSHPNRVDMYTLNNRLCMSTRQSRESKEIWRLKSSEDTWEKIYAIN